MCDVTQELLFIVNYMVIHRFFYLLKQTKNTINALFFAVAFLHFITVY